MSDPLSDMPPRVALEVGLLHYSPYQLLELLMGLYLCSGDQSERLLGRTAARGAYPWRPGVPLPRLGVSRPGATSQQHSPSKLVLGARLEIAGIVCNASLRYLVPVVCAASECITMMMLYHAPLLLHCIFWHVCARQNEEVLCYDRMLSEITRCHG